MGQVVDIYGRQLDKGDFVNLKNVETYPFEIVDMGELTMQPGGQPGVNVRTIRMVITADIKLPCPDMLGAATLIPVYLVKKADPPKQEGALQ